MTFHNANSLGSQSEEEAKNHNWHRMDCLAANQLKIERDPLKLKKWFSTQDKEWQVARKDRFNSRVGSRFGMYV